MINLRSYPSTTTRQNKTICVSATENTTERVKKAPWRNSGWFPEEDTVNALVSNDLFWKYLSDEADTCQCVSV